jgi:hypothetical protein
MIARASGVFKRWSTASPEGASSIAHAIERDDLFGVTQGATAKWLGRFLRSSDRST